MWTYVRVGLVWKLGRKLSSYLVSSRTEKEYPWNTGQRTGIQNSWEAGVSDGESGEPQTEEPEVVSSGFTKTKTKANQTLGKLGIGCRTSESRWGWNPSFPLSVLPSSLSKPSLRCIPCRRHCIWKTGVVSKWGHGSVTPDITAQSLSDPWLDFFKKFVYLF